MDYWGRTFQPFPRLPAELRLQVWEQSPDNWREVDVRVKSGQGPEGRFSVHLFSQTTTPEILHTCREARYSGAYQQAFSEIPFRIGANERSYVWINWDCDNIQIGKTPLYHYRYEAIQTSIQYLHFVRDKLHDWEVEDLKRCVNLKLITIICKSGATSWHRAFRGCLIDCEIELTVWDDPDGYQNMYGDYDDLIDKALDDPHQEWSIEITPRFFRGS
ncbi:uncharacterized protein B0T23DRAFT_399508 [Neurospora hispaniola]|uniref:2EXR domain-containing protein n=1 Tax=Neurospora hispaniola TaxID=588809 RepID=A0AAJ0MMA6_9PEZI|nr:hypothetical protein B0T23DRAFT_399508 [Neurospora hispaniola]